MKRSLAFLSMLLLAWFVMATTHEIGHLIGGWVGGARVVDFDLAPWRLPYSIHQPDPHPRLTLWAGPVLGILLPVSVALATGRKTAWFVADFCVLANGSYLALAWISGDPQLDTPRMLQAGVHPAWIFAFCAVTISIGYVRFRADCAGWLTKRCPDASSRGSNQEP